jgi:hypothetical protein
MAEELDLARLRQDVNECHWRRRAMGSGRAYSASH